MPATYKIFVDWAGNGIGTDPYDDVTARSLDQRTPPNARYGRDTARQLSPTSPGELGFELNNQSGDYSPDKATSPLAGYVQPGRPVVFQATVGVTTTTLFNGYLDDFSVKPGINDESVPVSCIDALGRLRGQSVTTSLYRGIRTGEAIGYILDAVGWPPDARDLDVGVTWMPYWWVDDADAFDSIQQLVDSDGPSALVTVDSQGRIVFRDRHARLTRTPSLTAVATWRSSGVEPCISDPLTYDHGWKEIVNSVSMDVPIRTIAATQSVVWSVAGQISVTAGVALAITAQGSSAFTDAVAPVAGTDYTVVSGTVSVAISRTSGQSTVITLTSAGGAVIQDLALRALAVQSVTQIVTVEDPSSIGRYGRRAMQTGRLPVWANAYDTLAVLSLIIGKRSERLPTLTVTMRGAGNAIRLNECLTRNLSDRIRLIESLTGFDSDCFIERIEHTVGQGGLEHVTAFSLEKVPITTANPFTFDVAGKGFDQGQFQGPGLDVAATMFRFDTAGQGFDQGLMAY